MSIHQNVERDQPTIELLDNLYQKTKIEKKLNDIHKQT